MAHNKVTYQEFGEFTLVTHSTGRLRFAIWHKSEEICWCSEREIAVHIIEVLLKTQN